MSCGKVPRVKQESKVERLPPVALQISAALQHQLSRVFTDFAPSNVFHSTVNFKKRGKNERKNILEESYFILVPIALPISKYPRHLHPYL